MHLDDDAGARNECPFVQRGLPSTRHFSIVHFVATQQFLFRCNYTQNSSALLVFGPRFRRAAAGARSALPQLSRTMAATLADLTVLAQFEGTRVPRESSFLLTSSFISAPRRARTRYLTLRVADTPRFPFLMLLHSTRLAAPLNGPCLSLFGQLLTHPSRVTFPWHPLRHALYTYFGSAPPHLDAAKIGSGWNGLSLILTAFKRLEVVESEEETAEVVAWLKALKMATVKRR